jgi:hypothetical protein
MSRIGFLAFCCLALAGGLAAQQEAARKPLADGLFLQGVDGRLVRDDVNDVWLFDLTNDVNVPGAQVSAGTELPLLASTPLESMIDDSNDRVQPLYRLSVLVTRYEGKNYLLPMYYLPLSRLTEPNEARPEAGKPAGTGVEPNSALPIPGEITEMLKNRRPLRAQQRQVSPETTEVSRMLVDVVGFIERRQDRVVFVPDAMGLNVSGKEYQLLPNAMLEQAQKLQAGTPDRVRFSIAGLLTDFKGKQYLLLQRATRAYSFGDFTG